MKKKTVLIVCLLILLSLSFPGKVMAEHNGLALADSSSVSCYSLDVIFVIDQSISMSNAYATDPTNQRQDAVQAMVDWLGENVLNVCPNARHQVGVISFGTKSRIDLPLTQVAPTTTQELLALDKQIDQHIVADNLGGTEPLEAFREIPTMFANSKITTGGPRKRVVIFLTDGLIGTTDTLNAQVPLGYTGNTQVLVDYINDILPFDPTLLKREQCISFEVDAYGKFENVPYDKLNKCLSDNNVPDQAYSQSTYLYIVLMNFGQAWPPDVKKLYQSVAARHAGTVMDFYDTGSQNRGGIPAYFQTVLSTLTGVPTGQVQCGGVVVNPYLQKAIFQFYKFSASTEVTLRYTDANGTEHKMVGGESDSGGFNVEDYQPYGANERYIFDKPYPGIWYIGSDHCKDGGINAFYQQVQVNPGGFTLSLPVLPKHDLPPYYDNSSPTYLTYQMHDDAGNVIDNSAQPVFNINAQATVTSPSGEKTNYALNWVPEQHIFQASQPLKIPEAGTYRVSFTGTTKIHTGDLSTNLDVLSKVFNTDQVIFQNENLEFTVKDVQPFVIQILRPADKQVLPQIHNSILSGWPLTVAPVPVRVDLRGRSGALSASISQIISDPQNAFTAWVTMIDGTTSQKITLKQDPNSPGQFIGQIPWSDTQSPATMHVQLVSGYSTGYAPDSQEVEATFSRQDLNPLYRAGFYIFLLILLIMIALGWIIYYIWLHTNPVRGTLVLSNETTEVKTMGIGNGRRIRKFKFKGKGLDLDVLYVRRAPKWRASATDDDPTDISADSVLIYGKTECHQKFSKRLVSGEKDGYCNTHIEFNIQYLGADRTKTN